VEFLEDADRTFSLVVVRVVGCCAVQLLCSCCEEESIAPAFGFDFFPRRKASRKEHGQEQQQRSRESEIYLDLDGCTRMYLVSQVKPLSIEQEQRRKSKQVPDLE